MRRKGRDWRDYSKARGRSGDVSKGSKTVLYRMNSPSEMRSQTTGMHVVLV